ncbi:DNA polymerase-3 subunit gamma/tau [Silvibacterium bohemicum]|uniref:DNA polymerase III subunit gamma/tau n=1 Tax=Silvibacterium bohemicum TaxID=1577686 RepID=A0A841JY44_9BACT|nr:DNA polymerase III subunit gamma/tau [Silvibacterium bohemicum]MBB6143901.1 DNA polymerase-3 subunit gamma/tau [Silvibacterium bohemicum]
MAYQVLARKYRPQRFSDVAGQDHVTRTLLNALSQGRIAHGYIFSGHRGIGKTTIARILAMALNCRTEIGSAQRPTPEPCAICESCTEIRAGNAVDVIEIDAATNRGIDEIRELRDAARYRPARDRYKIYILDEAHQITDAAFNALLKTLEEPPDHVVFMMATTQPEDIPQTIRSRCQHFSFHAVKFDDILAQLRDIAAKEGITAEDAALALLAEAGDGSMRDALSIMDQAIASAPVEDGQPRLDAEQIRELMGTVPNAVFERLMDAIGEGQTATVIEELNRLLNAGNSPSQLARQFVRYLRNVLMARIGGENSELLQISPDERARAARSALLFSEEDLTRFLQIMLRTFDELNYRQEQRFHLELGLIKLVHLTRLLPIEELLSKLPASPARSATGGGALPQPARSQTPSSAPRTSPAAGSTAQPRTTTASPAVSPAPRTPEPSKPAFSPFDADRNRKITSEAATPTPAAPLPTPVAVAMTSERVLDRVPASVAVADPIEDFLEEQAPAPIAAISSTPTSAPIAGRPIAEIRVTETVVVSDPVSTVSSLAMAAPLELATSIKAPVASETTSGALALAADPSDSLDLDLIRDTISTALEAQGHSTAAVLLSAGQWREKGGGIEVEVGIKKTMLGLTINAEADKICKSALRAIGVNRKLTFIPGEASAASSSSGPRLAAKPAATGSIQAMALANPLVKQAQELFGAEVRSVLDLREGK